MSQSKPKLEGDMRIQAQDQRKYTIHNVNSFKIFFYFYFFERNGFRKGKNAISIEGAQVGQQNQPFFFLYTDNGNGYASMASLNRQVAIRS